MMNPADFEQDMKICFQKGKFYLMCSRKIIIGDMSPKQDTQKEPMCAIDVFVSFWPFILHVAQPL